MLFIRLIVVLACTLVSLSASAAETSKPNVIVILADDMGLGKTLQLIALVLRRREARVKAKQPLAPSLVVAPASLLANWEREFRKFAPEVPVVIAQRSSLSAV